MPFPSVCAPSATFPGQTCSCPDCTAIFSQCFDVVCETVEVYQSSLRSSVPSEPECAPSVGSCSNPLDSLDRAYSASFGQSPSPLAYFNQQHWAFGRRFWFPLQCGNGIVWEVRQAKRAEGRREALAILGGMERKLNEQD